ncbi:hypothetical protein EDD85DRAFT_792259 [Armillaria nabsnona]|nr:hypothetical protein EDD85DRAFT_792259 [Armillaria nabsnona]
MRQSGEGLGEASVESGTDLQQWVNDTLPISKDEGIVDQLSTWILLNSTSDHITQLLASINLLPEDTAHWLERTTTADRERIFERTKFEYSGSSDALKSERSKETISLLVHGLSSIVALRVLGKPKDSQMEAVQSHRAVGTAASHGEINE